MLCTAESPTTTPRAAGRMVRCRRAGVPCRAPQLVRVGVGVKVGLGVGVGGLVFCRLSHLLRPHKLPVMYLEPESHAPRGLPSNLAGPRVRRWQLLAHGAALPQASMCACCSAWTGGRAGRRRWRRRGWRWRSGGGVWWVWTSAATPGWARWEGCSPAASLLPAAGVSSDAGTCQPCPACSAAQLAAPRHPRLLQLAEGQAASAYDHIKQSKDSGPGCSPLCSGTPGCQRWSSRGGTACV
jgi:hypothetical protein